VLVLAIIALGIPLAINLSSRVRAEVQTQAQAQADLVAATAADLLGPGHRRELSTLARTAARELRGRILVVGAAGGVLIDSSGAAAVGTNYRSRPELRAALAGRPVQVQRSSRTLGKEILATAVPIIRNRHTVGAVRVTQSIAAVNGAVHRAQLGLILIGVIVLALGLLAGVVIAAQVARPIRRLEQVARRVAQGDLEARAELEGSSEQRSLATSFNEMTDRISRLLGAQRAFVADASHQLRTPLTGLRLRLEAARTSAVGDAARDQLEAAVHEVDRLAHTVEDLLVLSSGGERQLRGTIVDLHHVAAAAAERWEPTARSRTIKLVSDAEDGGGRAWVSRPDLDRALDSLIENALNYSPGGSAVEIRATPGRIEVRDRGPGIAADELPIVFDRFHRGRAGRAGPAGSGLGLSIARELARAWGGDVTLTPRDGGGLVAALMLPASAKTPDEPSSLRALNPDPTTVARP
jgi:two-component system, OmpR family, sensor kinase